MSKRLLDDELEAALIEAGIDVPPPPDRLLERTLAAVGVAASVTAAAGSAAASGATATATKATGAAAAAKVTGAAVGVAGVAKAAVFGAVMGAFVVAGAVYVESTAPAPSNGADRVALATTAAPPAADTPRVLRGEQPSASPTTEPAPSALPVIPRAGGSVVKAPPPPSTASGPSGAASLALELTLLDAARGALDGGDPARALALLDQYTREFPLGRLAPEARVMRIEATARRGDRAAAQSMAREFLDDSPESPHADRVRKLGAMDGGVSNP